MGEKKKVSSASWGASRAGGFTVLELLFAIAVVGMLVGIGVPSMRGFIEDGQAGTAATDLVSDMYLARSSALKLSCDVTLKANTIGASTSWANGWKVTYKSKSTTDLACDSGSSVETVLKTREALSSVLSVSGAITSFDYGYDGNSSAAPVISIKAANANSSAKQRCVSMSLAGKPLVKVVDKSATC